jgi:hypothetical protein
MNFRGHAVALFIGTFGMPDNLARVQLQRLQLDPRVACRLPTLPSLPELGQVMSQLACRAWPRPIAQSSYCFVWMCHGCPC